MKELLDAFLNLLKEPIIIIGLIMVLSNFCFIEFLKEFRKNDKE